MWDSVSQFPDDVNLGDQALDHEHALILRHLTELRKAIAEKLPASDQRFLLHEFEMEVRENCRGEEQLMEFDEFPDLAAHRQSHRALFHVLARLESSLISGDTKAALEELRQIRDALLEHVTTEDARIAVWHNARNISPDCPD